MKAHTGVDARTGLTHSFTTTAANERDLNQTKNLINGDEIFIGADSGYRGAQKREELKDVTAQWLIAKMPSKIKVLKKRPRINKHPIKTEFIKTSIRAKVEHPFRIIKIRYIVAFSLSLRIN